MNQTTICIVNKMKNLKIQETQNIKLQITPLDIFDENGKFLICLFWIVITLLIIAQFIHI